MANAIEKQIEIKAPVSRVWRAITDYKQFGAWFRVDLEGPFVAGQEAKGHIIWPGMEHIVWRAVVQKIEPERLFSFTWHPYGIDPNIDYTIEEPTLVEFKLEPTVSGTRLTVTESGFDRVPGYRREEAFRMNDQGWSVQVGNIDEYVTANPD